MSKSVMGHTFNKTPRADIPRSSFDRSHGYKTTFDSSFLVPFYVDEALPGDTFNLKLTAFARLATPIKPILDNIFMETFFFAVPVRQIWDNWEKFNGEQTDPGDSTDFVVPHISTGGGNNTLHSVFDYMGIPLTPTAATLDVNSLHLRAYNHIYNNWFRDQNLIDSAPVDKSDGPDNTGDYPLRRRRKRPDYFTSCLPWPQKTQNPITVPIAGQAPLSTDSLVGSSDQLAVYHPLTDDHSYMNVDDASGRLTTGSLAFPANNPLYADLTVASGISINELRQSFQIQKLAERDARSGTRYPEILKSHFGVTDPAMLVLQRPEFLGGGSSMVNINPVQQTSDSGSDVHTSLTPQGNLSAFGTVTLKGHGFTKSFTEHCVIIGLVNARTDITYQTGLDRMWSRQTRFDYYWPALQGIGEQAVTNREIYAQGDVNDPLVFGYIPRYDEYRYKPSLITGLFRSSRPSSLDVWHLSQEFANLPVLGQTFIEDDPPIDRIIAVQSEPQFLFDAYINLRCARPMPLYGNPGMIDHF